MTAEEGDLIARDGLKAVEEGAEVVDRVSAKLASPERGTPSVRLAVAARPCHRRPRQTRSGQRARRALRSGRNRARGWVGLKRISFSQSELSPLTASNPGAASSCVKEDGGAWRPGQRESWPLASREGSQRGGEEAAVVAGIAGEGVGETVDDRTQQDGGRDAVGPRSRRQVRCRRRARSPRQRPGRRRFHRSTVRTGRRRRGPPGTGCNRLIALVARHCRRDGEGRRRALQCRSPQSARRSAGCRHGESCCRRWPSRRRESGRRMQRPAGRGCRRIPPRLPRQTAPPLAPGESAGRVERVLLAA